MIIPLMRYGGAAQNMPKYSCTGTTPQFFSDKQGNWEIVFLADCQITFSKLPGPVDAFLVGGGAAATGGQGYADFAQGGSGGRGGGTLTASPQLQTGVRYTVTIGGSGQSTAAFGLTAPAGQGAYGGIGASSSNRTGNKYTTPAGNGNPGVMAFGTADTLYRPGAKYGPGGGGGGANTDRGYVAPGSGGADGGGNGGSDTAYGQSGGVNTGGGGGGPYREPYREDPGGSGGSGIVILRNARSNT